MEIRAYGSAHTKISKMVIPDDITLTEDKRAEVPVIMIKDGGALHEWTRGLKNIMSYLDKGYVEFRRKCPHRHRKCIGNKCSYYLIQNGTGDCCQIWTAVLLNKKGEK